MQHTPDDPKVSILLVDDEPANLTAIKAILADLDLNIVTALSGEEALKRVQEQEFALLLLDVRMSGMDGFETAQRVRQVTSAIHTPIIFISSDESHELASRVYEMGAVDYLAKPLVPNILRAKVKGLATIFQDRERARRQAEELSYLSQANSLEQQQREQLLVTLHSIGDAVIVTDMNGLITFMNPVAEGLTGWKSADAIGQLLDKVFHIVHEETRQLVENPVSKVLREGVIVGLANHTILLAKDGREIPIDDSGAPIRDEQGAVGGVVLVFRDVTEARRAAETRVRLAAIVESSNDAIIGENLDGTITAWNRAAEKLYGYTAQEAIGQPITLLVPPDRLDELGSIMERLRRGEMIPPFESVRLRRGGVRVDVSLTISPIRNLDDKIIGASKIARDITETKSGAQALRASETRKAAMLNAALDCVVTIDHEGKILEFNPAAERTFLYQRADVLGQQMAELIIPPSYREQHYRGLVRYLETGEGPVLGKRLELVAMRSDGREFPVELSISAISTGRSPVFTAYLRDITDRHNLERRRSARVTVTQILADAATLSAATPRILQSICESLDWDVGAIWILGSANELQCVDFWSRPTIQVDSFEKNTRSRSFPAGVGLPGRVWRDLKAVWIPDVAQDDNFPRAANAAESGLHGAFGCPIAVGREFLGVIEFFSYDIREPDADVLEMMSTIGGQIGQFIERRQAEDKLRESERRFAGFMHHFPGLAWIKDRHGRYVFANDAAMKGFGRSERDLYGKTDDDVFPPETAAMFRENDRLAMGSESGVQLVETLRHPDGTIHHSIVNKFPILGQNHEPVLVGGMAIDVTDRIRGEEQTQYLADASVTLASLVDYESTLRKVATLSVPQFADWCAVDIVESDGSLRRLAVAHIEPAKIKLAHQLDERYPAKQFAAHGPYHVLQTGQAELIEDIPDELLAEFAVDSDHLRLLRELGLKSYMCVALKVRMRTLGIMTFATAESRRRYSRGDLIIAEELARRAAIAIENAQLVEDLKEGDRLKDEFLAMLAHELRNPLAPIRNALQVMKMPSVSDLILEQVRDMAERQVQHMAHLLDDLLDVSRISRGMVELRKQPVDMVEVVNRTVEAVHSLIENRQHRLLIALPPENIWVEGDPTRLEQVLTNLLHNAAKYTDPGGQISVTLDREDSLVVLRVRDTGIGIPVEVLPRIFDLFVQVERRLDRSQGGVGIGLTLVKRLVELHGGTVEAISQGPGKGSEFIVRLPTIREQLATPKGRASESEQMPNTPARRLLVVDDNHDAADSLAMLLRLSGHDVHVAYSGPEALNAAEQHSPHTIFLDIGMPGMDGYEVAKRMRQIPSMERVRLIALTGWGQEEDRRRTKEAGFDHHLVKPVEPSTLQNLFQS